MSRVPASLVLLLVLAAASQPDAQAPRTTLRVASLAPSRSVWDNSLQQMRADWQTRTASILE